MQANHLLSIVIPTFNRADFLDHCLEVHIPLARTHNILIFISDNASTNATSEVVRKRKEEYQLIQFRRNETNFGPDKNFELALKYPQTDYVWLLGDTYQIPPDGIDYLLKLFAANKHSYDATVFNSENRVFDVTQKDYSDQNLLLSELGWHMTCIASVIYSTKLIAKADFRRYRNTFFIQTGVIFEEIANKDFFVHWADNISVKGISIKSLLKKSWQDQTFEIWVLKWSNFIFSLPPSYDLNTKLKCIKDHGIKSDLFVLRNLRDLRISNILNFKVYKHYSHLFPLTICYSKIIISLVMLFPRTTYIIFKAIKIFVPRLIIK